MVRLKRIEALGESTANDSSATVGRIDPTVGEIPRVSVIVPHFQDLANLEICLVALGSQTLPSGQFEIIVADNGSPSGKYAIQAVIAGRARLVVVNERGAGLARNGAAAAARGDLLAFTDCDCRPSPDWLSRGLAALDDYDVVGGRMIVTARDAGNPTAVEAFELVFAFDNESYVRKNAFTVTANLFCGRTVFEAVGGFKVGLSEDVDWCLRAATGGYRLGYEAGAIVDHPARRNWPELIRKWRRINAETFDLMKDQPFGATRWLLRSLAMPISILAHAPRVLTSDRLTNGRQRAGALKILAALRLWRFWDGLRLSVRRP